MTDEFDEVLTQLEPLRFTPDRSEAATRSGLQNFLKEAATLRPPVSDQPRRRLTGWILSFGFGKKFTQERSPMFAIAIKVVLVVAVMFGGAGVTAVAAQNSLPNEALYPIKLFMEDVQWGGAQTPEAQIDVQLDHAQQRVREMAQLTDQGAAIPADVPVRLQTQLQAALQIAAQLDDQALPGALDRIQLRLRDQLREMEQLHLNDAVQTLTQAQTMAQLGQQDPQAFRMRYGHGRPADTPPQPVMTPGADPSRTPQGPHSTMTPQPSRTPQPLHTPQATGTPQNNSYGPGPQNSQPAATPVGQGDGHEYGPGPQATMAPGGGEPQGTQDGLGGNGDGNNGGTNNSGDNGGGNGSGDGNNGGDNGGGNGSGGGNTGGGGGGGH